jgi:hypothetical protein
LKKNSIIAEESDYLRKNLIILEKKNMPIFWENLKIVAKEVFPNSNEDDNTLVKKYANTIMKDSF